MSDIRSVLNKLHYTGFMETHASNDSHVDEALQAIREIALACAPDMLPEPERPYNIQYSEFSDKELLNYTTALVHNNAIDLYTERLRAAFGESK